MSDHNDLRVYEEALLLVASPRDVVASRKREQLRSFDIAMTSAREVQSILDVGLRIRAVRQALADSLRDRSDHVCAMLFKLIARRRDD